MNLIVLQTLVNLARQQSTAAATALAKEIAALNEARGKAELLTNYLDDYRAKLQQQMLMGLKVAQLINSQNFMQQIELAIKQQEKSIIQSENQVEQAKKHWQECERKSVTFEALIKRSKAKAALIEARLDQKNTDEFAARKFASTRML
jgi:flagellar FliJ protein